MSKKFLAEVIQQSAAVTGVAASRTAGDLLDALVTKIRADGSLNIPGFGTFRLVETKPRKGYNPRTGKPVAIAAGRTVRFKASPTLKEAL